MKEKQKEIQACITLIDKMINRVTRRDYSLTTCEVYALQQSCKLTIDRCAPSLAADWIVIKNDNYDMQADAIPIMYEVQLRMDKVILEKAMELVALD